MGKYTLSLEIFGLKRFICQICVILDYLSRTKAAGISGVRSWMYFTIIGSGSPDRPGFQLHTASVKVFVDFFIFFPLSFVVF